MKRFLTALIFTLLILSIVWIYKDNQPAGITKLAKSRSALGGKDNPLARVNYETLRLADPVSGQIPQDIRQKELAYAAELPVRNNRPVFLKNGAVADVTAAQFKRRGPYNVGGRTRALALDRNNESIILAGGVSGGMWRTTDGGVKWSKVTAAEQLHSVTCLVQDKRSGQGSTWFYGSGELIGNSANKSGSAPFRGDGVFKSVDNGLTWNLLPATSTGKPHTFDNDFDYIWNLAIDPTATADIEIYAATYGSIYRSTNGGDNWTKVLETVDPNYSRYTDVEVTTQGVVYASLSSDGGSQAGIYRSTDGLSWTKITPPGFPSEYDRIDLEVSQSNPNLLYLVGYTPDNGALEHELWRYDFNPVNSKGTWQDLTNSLPALGGSTGNFDSQTGYDLFVKIHPANADYVFLGGTNLFRSNNGFASSLQTTWIGGYTKSNDSYAEYTNHHPDQHALVFYPSNQDKALSGHDGGISLTTNLRSAAVNWAILNRGYYTTQFYTITIEPTVSGDASVIGGMQDNGSYIAEDTTSTVDWSQILSGDGAFCAISPGMSYIYVSAQEGQTYQWRASNCAWARVDPSGGGVYLFINPFTLDPNKWTRMFMASGNFLWRNSDLTQLPTGGNYDPPTTNWAMLTHTNVGTDVYISAVAVARSSSNRVYYGTTDGRLFKLDNAASGDPASVELTGTAFPSGFINCIAVNPDNANDLLVVFSNYLVHSLFHSTDGGSSWETAGGNLEAVSDGSGAGPSLRWAVYAKNVHNTQYFISTSTGVYSSTKLDGMNTVWQQESADLIGNVVVDMLAYRSADRVLVAASHGGGVFSATLPVDDPTPVTPGEFILAQNRPNPFNGETTIYYNVEEAGAVKLIIYDLQGRKVKTLVDKNFDTPASEQPAYWVGNDDRGWPVASGLYLYNLQTGGKSYTRKMIYVR